MNESRALLLFILATGLYCSAGFLTPAVAQPATGSGSAETASPDSAEAPAGMEQNITLPDGSVRNVRDYLAEFVRDYKRVRAHHSASEMRQVSTVGLLAGMLRIEELMRAALSNRTHRFQAAFDRSTAEQVLEQLYHLDGQMLRDRKAIEFLGQSLDVATNLRTFEAFREEADELLRTAIRAQLEAAQRRQVALGRVGRAMRMGSGEQMVPVVMRNETTAVRAELKKRVAEAFAAVEQHQREVRTMVKRRTQMTVRFLRESLAAGGGGEEPTEAEDANAVTDRPYESFSVGTSVLGQTLMSKLLGGRFRRQSPPAGSPAKGGALQEPVTTARSSLSSAEKQMEKQMVENEIKPARQEEEESESESVEDGPGGIVGLIASLSGGDEGSDVGALIGALTGVITNLLGPGGLDIEGLIGTGTALIAGLLGGDDNFGKVLGVYVGTALDGLSGGGGAANNGQFFGQFLGTVIAYLSADPDDDDLPLKPKLFLQNFFSGSQATISKAGADGDHMEAKPSGGSGGSDLFGFIGNIIGSIVAGVTSLIVNTSVGSSGGSSQGSADLLGGASGASSAGSNAKPMCPCTPMCPDPCNN